MFSGGERKDTLRTNGFKFYSGKRTRWWKERPRANGQVNTGKLWQLCKLWHTLCMLVNPLSANITKWSNTPKQFVGNLPTNCLSVFEHFVGLALTGLIARFNMKIKNFSSFTVLSYKLVPWNFCRRNSCWRYFRRIYLCDFAPKSQNEIPWIFPDRNQSQK